MELLICGEKEGRGAFTWGIPIRIPASDVRDVERVERRVLDADRATSRRSSGVDVGSRIS
jgi:hypothetical protein